MRLPGPWNLMALLLCAIFITGCGEPAPVATTLSALSAAQTDFHGRQVLVTGTLRTFDTPRHYWIENATLERVAIQSTQTLTPLVGRTIRVQGKFKYDSSVGRRIEATAIHLLQE